jgi:hypothetical protein
MMKNNRYVKITRWLLMACLTLLNTSCRETLEQLLADDIEAGDEVQFTAVMQQRASTRGAATTVDLSTHYLLTVSMYTDDTHKVGDDGVYSVSKDGGTLEAVTPLYWPSNIITYGFKAVAGTETLSADQSTAANWLQQDRLEGGTGMYLTAKEWKKTTGDKTVPLDMYHTRSLITIVLKPGEGVTQESLEAANNLNVKVYSHTKDKNPIVITPLASKTTVSYDAIVMPYDYATNTESLITQIVLSGQKYSFYARNDVNESRKKFYNLEAGQHLTITVTLGRDSRHVLMTAQIEDWTEEVTDAICDDHGYSGEPIKIDSRDRLIDFLTSATENKAGNLALVTNNIDLGTWPATGEGYDLNCALSLGGNTLTSSKCFLKSIGSAASLQNGTIQISGTVDAAIAHSNSGTINDINIKDAAGACATVAGAVVNNHGVISKCHSWLKVTGSGTEDYVGGIAATSMSTGTKTAIIDGCTVTNRVGGGIAGGGIVGNADGKVTNNTFEYGITLSQSANHKNIAGAYNGSDFANNAWPTIAEEYSENATPTAKRYTGIIDDVSEFSLTKTSGRYRLAQDIEVTNTIGDVDYELDGNNKKMTTTAMIFKAITGKVHDLKVYVSDNLIATPAEQAEDAIAPLAYEVYGASAEISHIKVLTATGKRIQAANPAGVVVWAWGDATVSNCEVTADIQAWVENPAATVKKYAGGIVSTVSKAKVTQCVFHSAGSITQNRNRAYDNSGTDNFLAVSTCIYYGGIVGGIEKKMGSDDTESLTITDCTSYITTFILDNKDAYRGCILGYAGDNNDTNKTKDCQGNWWDADCRGVGTYAGSVEAAIGKRNGVTITEVPLKPEDF